METLLRIERATANLFCILRDCPGNQLKTDINKTKKLLNMIKTVITDPKESKDEDYILDSIKKYTVLRMRNT